MVISPETLQEVLSCVHIEEVVGEFITLKKKGQNLWACCPFHQEKTPSFSVSPTKGFYKCFGCGAAGDAITFIREIEGVGFVDAITHLAQKYGITIQESTQGPHTQIQHEKDSLFIVSEAAKDYYQDILQNDPEGVAIGKSYVETRQFSENVIKKFALGYSLDSWDAFCRFAQKKGYHDTLLEKVGLVIRKEERVYDRFRGRLLFPIHNPGGKVVAFAARTLQRNSKQPKYINSPETLIYHKSNLLYGMFQAKKAIQKLDHCYLVEGYTDVIRLHMMGILNVVASSGTSLTDKQVQQIGKLTQNLTVLFDGDVAGVKASLRGIDIILAQGLDVKVVPLPEGEDPDSYAQQVGVTALQKYLQENNQDFLTFKVTLLLQEAQNDPVLKAKVIQEVIQSISSIPDPIKRTVWIQQCSQLLQIDVDILTAEQEKNLLRQQQHEHQQQKRKALREGTVRMTLLPLEDSIKMYERESMRMLLNHGSTLLDNNEPLYKYLMQELQDVHFCTPIYKRMIEDFHHHLAQDRVVDATYWIHHQDDDIQREAIDLMASPYTVSDQWEERHQIAIEKEEDDVNQAAFKNILRLKLRLVQQLITENQEALKKAPNAEEEDKLLHIHSELKQAEGSIAKQLGIVIW